MQSFENTFFKLPQRENLTILNESLIKLKMFGYFAKNIHYNLLLKIHQILNESSLIKSSSEMF